MIDPRQTSRIKDARLLIEHESSDIVVCNREFEGLDEVGEDAFDLDLIKVA